MASEPTLIITLGKHNRWLSKPADYTSLLDCARQRFNELKGLQDEDIIFCFTPEWVDEELELDGSTFQYVHDKARLRIDTRRPAGQARPKRSTDPLNGELDKTNSEPCRKRTRTEQDPIDLTLAPPLTASPLRAAPAAAPSPVPELVTAEIAPPKQSLLDRDVQSNLDGTIPTTIVLPLPIP